jgi:hypothetical protein
MHWKLLAISETSGASNRVLALHDMAFVSIPFEMALGSDFVVSLAM